MKHRHFICIAAFFVAILTLIASGLQAQVGLPKHFWRATLKVVDESGQPVSGATMHVWYGSNDISGLSDAKGFFIASHEDATEDLAFWSDKKGYYPFRMGYHKGRTYSHDKFTPAETILLKRIINPIPMYAKNVNSGVPVRDKPIGYDLQRGDWIAPYGKGTESDILFTAHLEKPAADELKFKLTVSFPNKSDGIQEFKSPVYYLGSSGSELRSLENAPADGYQAEWIQSDERKPGHPYITNRDLNRNFYFRIRTTLNADGKVVSACYGKIYGDFMSFKYYLNPNPNDRNVEFDPKKNLVKNLNGLETVPAP